MRAGLAASTVTPGSTAPEESLATPAMDACAYADEQTMVITDENSTASLRIRPTSTSHRRDIVGADLKVGPYGRGLYRTAASTSVPGHRTSTAAARKRQYNSSCLSSCGAAGARRRTLLMIRAAMPRSDVRPSSK